MSTLQVANIHLESTANNRIQFLSPNTVQMYAGGQLVFSANTTSIIASNNLTLNSTLRANNSLGTAGQALLSAGSTANAYWGTPSSVTSGVSVASTSGVSVDFTGIPSGVKRITVMFNGVSTSGTSPKIIQLGDSGGIENTGYTSGAAGATSTGTYSTSTAGFLLTYTNNSLAAGLLHGSVIITNFSDNTWVASGVLHETSYTIGSFVAGGKTLSAILDRIRITTVNGTDTFDAGSINILYER